MNLMLFIYLCDLLPSLGNFTFCIALISAIFALFSLVLVVNDYFTIVVTFRLTLAAVVFGLLAAVIPSQKTMYMMGGAYVAQQAIESPLATKVVGIIGNRLDEYLLEDSKENKNDQ